MRTCSRTCRDAPAPVACNAATGAAVAISAFQIHWKKVRDLLLIVPLTFRLMTDSELEVLFRTWWQQSYPTPPGPHALITHIGWARFLLEQTQQRREPKP